MSEDRLEVHVWPGFMSPPTCHLRLGESAINLGWIASATVEVREGECVTLKLPGAKLIVHRRDEERS